WGLWLFSLVRAEYQTARERAAQLLSLAQSLQDPALLLEAHFALGVTLFWLGEFAAARTHLDQGFTLYAPPHPHAAAFQYGFEDGILCLSYVALALWFLGYPDQALTRGYTALSLAQELAHPHTLALALNFVSFLHQFRREGPAAQERAEGLLGLCREQGFPHWLTEAT